MTPSQKPVKSAKGSARKQRWYNPRPELPEPWAEAANQVGGRIHHDRHTSEVHIEHGPWTVILDKHMVNAGQSTVPYTRVRAYFLARDDFSMCVSRRNFGSRILGLLGFPGAFVGDRALEERYRLTTNHRPRLRSLLTDRTLRELVMAQPKLKLDVKGLSWRRRRKLGSRLRVATVSTMGILTDVQQVVGLIRLMQATLDQLARIGGAQPTGVDMEGHNGDIRRGL